MTTDAGRVLSVYVTSADAGEARRIGRALVEENLAACVNILPGHTAIYRWEGKLEEGAECAFLAKTTAERFEARPVRVEPLDGGRVLVAEGIGSGKRVVTQGAELLDQVR